MTFYAKDEYEAAQQAWATLDDAIRFRTGATGLYVSDPWGEHKVLIDMEYVGFCNECNKVFNLANNEDHCTECGNCFEHCVNPDEHSGLGYRGPV